MYTEYRPPAALAASVECFWTNTPDDTPDGDSTRRVMPDGAIDIVLTFDGDAMTPATARIVRLQTLMRRARLTPDWSALAHALGFADQSHLVNDFRDLTGLTPTAWLQSLVPKFQDGIVRDD